MSTGFRCVIENLKSGARWEVPLRNETGDWPKFIGSAADCEIRIDDPGIAAHEVRLDPGGIHNQVTPLGAAVARVRNETVSPGKTVRVDGPFEIGDFRFQLGFPDDDEGD